MYKRYIKADARYRQWIALFFWGEGIVALALTIPSRGAQTGSGPGPGPGKQGHGVF